MVKKFYHNEIISDEILGGLNLKKNFMMDLLIFISGLICIVTGIILDFHLLGNGREARMFCKDIHTYSGYIMSVGLIFHIAWHTSWIKSAAKSVLFKCNKNVKR